MATNTHTYLQALKFKKGVLPVEHWLDYNFEIRHIRSFIHCFRNMGAWEMVGPTNYLGIANFFLLCLASLLCSLHCVLAYISLCASVCLLTSVCVLAYISLLHMHLLSVANNTFAQAAHFLLPCTELKLFFLKVKYILSSSSHRSFDNEKLLLLWCYKKKIKKTTDSLLLVSNYFSNIWGSHLCLWAAW